MHFHRSSVTAFATFATVMLLGHLAASGQVAAFDAVAVRQTVSKDSAGYVLSTFAGAADRFGPFSGTARIKCKGHHCQGVAILDFGSGDTIEFFTEVRFDTHYQLGEGTYVITGGTGRFAGVSGRGYFAVDERLGHDQAHLIWQGTIDP